MRLKLVLLFTLLGLTACSFARPTSPAAPSVSAPTEAGARTADTSSGPVASVVRPVSAVGDVSLAADQLETIVLPISVYILDDEAGELSSSRTSEQLEEIYGKVNEIWSPAGIELEVQTIQRVEIPAEYLEVIAARNFQLFFRGAGRDFNVPEPALLNAFYAKGVGGPNGITPAGSRVFFVTDQPSVHHERVSSHEIGHILGLHHVPDDVNRLMFSGTNGMALSEEEIIVARYAARGLLAGVR